MWFNQQSWTADMVMSAPQVIFPHLGGSFFPGTFPVVKQAGKWCGKIHGKNMRFSSIFHVWIPTGAHQHPETIRNHGFLGFTSRGGHIDFWWLGYYASYYIVESHFGYWLVNSFVDQLKFVWVKCRWLLGEIKKASLVKFKWSCYLLCLSQISSCCYGKSPFFMGKSTINGNFQ